MNLRMAGWPVILPADGDSLRGSGGEHRIRVKRAIRQAASRQGDISGFQITNYPASIFSPIPKIVRKIGAEDPVQQIVEVLVPPALKFGDIDTDLLPDFGREFERRFAGFQRP